MFNIGKDRLLLPIFYRILTPAEEIFSPAVYSMDYFSFFFDILIHFTK